MPAMGRLGKKQRDALSRMFGERVSFHRIERKLYGRDIAALPSLFQSLVEFHHSLLGETPAPQTA